MTWLRTRLADSLSDLSADRLDEITADGHAFASPGWYRLLEAVNLAELTSGQIQLRFAIVEAAGTPVAILPVMRARGDGLYFLYSLRRFYFEHWIDEAVRLNPGKREKFARIFTGVSAYRRLLEWTGSPLDDCLIATNPLSYRGTIAVAPSAPVERTAIYRSLVEELQRQARRIRRPLWFFGIEGDAGRWQTAMKQAGCEPVFLFHDNRLDLDQFDTFDDYLQSFRRTTRRAFGRDIRRTEAAGVEFRIIDDFADDAEAFSSLYTETYQRYGESYFRHPPGFWRALSRSLGPAAEAIVAHHQENLAGFSVLLKSRRRGEMWTYRLGRQHEGSLRDVPYYFVLSFYEPIRRALELGYRRLWLGPAGYEAKSVRGAVQVPLYSHFWFPRRFDRWLLQPYLKLFGRMSRQQMAQALSRPTKEDAVAVDAP